ncbi:hypothetical protein [Vibrio sp. D431a]|uniref:hypothetical protein n=1 Tax=Vibrio sp. D431a TaxID=2837388 RepID=UPI002553C595|nr:hypothetical protein [Vibrio sp. D431a]MDK9790191.1 hypothetical protein [Vibrio sp. D431a]
MQGKFITISEFEAFKANELSSVLSLLKMNLRNTNLLNQAAARGLGFTSYEALEPLFERENAIKNNFYIEKAEEQGGRITVKSSNVIAVFDLHVDAIFCRTLISGEESTYLSKENSTKTISLKELSLTDKIELSKALNAPAKNRCSGGFELRLDNEKSVKISRSKKSLNIKVGSQFEDLDYDARGQSCADVDLVTPVKVKACDAYYKFVKQVTVDGEAMFLHLDSSGYEVDLSSLKFTSPEEARLAIEGEVWGWNSEDVEGAVLVRVEMTFDSLFQSTNDAEVFATKGITTEYVRSRQKDFISALGKAYRHFGYSDQYIKERQKVLQNRFDTQDYKLYKDAPVGHLTASKRITRNEIKTAIYYCPARKAQIKSWREEYYEKCRVAASKSIDGSHPFGFFETEYSSKLAMNFSKYKEFFKI